MAEDEKGWKTEIVRGREDDPIVIRRKNGATSMPVDPAIKRRVDKIIINAQNRSLAKRIRYFIYSL